MNDNNTFYIDVDGTKIKATILINFTILNNSYCVYVLDDNLGDGMKDVFCAKIVDGNLIKIVDEDEKNRTDKIVKALINALEG